MTETTTLINEALVGQISEGQSPRTGKSVEVLIQQQLAHRFQLLGEIGVGGMGQVFKARDLELDRIVAIKAIHPKLVEDKEISDRLRNEAKIVAKLKHANIVQIYDMFEISGHYLMILEFIAGHDFKEIIDQGLLSREESILKFVDICDAVQYAHMQGIIHRDLKPHNIMLTSDGCIKIMDFGISSLIEEGRGEQEADNTSSLEGSPVFMAPELYDNKTPNTITDVYALGISLYLTLTGESPFSGKTREALIMNITCTGIPAPSSRHGGISPEIDAICEKACARDPDKRYQSPLEMGMDIRRFTQNLPVSARRYTLLESITRGITFKPVVSIFSFFTILLIFIAVYMGSNHVHKISEETLIASLRNNVGSTAYNASLALDNAAVVELIESTESSDRLLDKVDRPLAALQRYNTEIRDFYILSPLKQGKDFKIVFARHGEGNLDMNKILKGHDTWSANPTVENSRARGLMQQTMSGKIVIQEELDADSEHSNAWQKRILGYSPIYNNQGQAFAILVVEVSSGGIAKAYQQIEDAFQLALGFAVLMAVLIFAGIMMALVLLWKNTAPQR